MKLVFQYYMRRIYGFEVLNRFVQKYDSIHHNYNMIVVVRHTNMMPHHWYEFDSLRNAKHYIRSVEKNIAYSMHIGFLEKHSNIRFLEEALTNHAIELPSKAKTDFCRLLIVFIKAQCNIVFQKC